MEPDLEVTATDHLCNDDQYVPHACVSFTFDRREAVFGLSGDGGKSFQASLETKRTFKPLAWE